MKSPRGFDDERKLEEHFRLLRDAFSLPDDVELKWFRNNSCRYKGCVSRDLRTVYIFEEDLEEAKKVLTHEILDKLVTCLIKSGYKPNEFLYYQKEAVVDSIVPLMDLDLVRDVSRLQEDDEFVRDLRDYHLKKYLQRGAWFKEKYGNSLESVSDAWERIKQNREKIKKGDFGGVTGSQQDPQVKEDVKKLCETLYLDASGIEELREENIIKMLKTSEKFFKLFLDYELDELVDEFMTLYTNSTKSGNLYKNSSFLSHTKVSHEFFWSLFSHCVHQDILNNKLNEKALKLLDSYNQVTRKLERELEVAAH